MLSKNKITVWTFNLKKKSIKKKVFNFQQPCWVRRTEIKAQSLQMVKDLTCDPIISWNIKGLQGEDEIEEDHFFLWIA